MQQQAVIVERCLPCSRSSAAAASRSRTQAHRVAAGRDALPGLRSDAVDRVAGRGRPVTWPLAFLHLVAESARLALRELDRLEAAA
jgi:hypothetical protein